MITPGVLNGSKGRLFYPEHEVMKDPTDWNGMPITVNHPVDREGNPETGRDPEISDRYKIGEVFHSNTNGNKLKSKAYIDIELARNKLTKVPGGAKVFDDLMAGRPVELSTGLYTTNVPAGKGANYNGKPYDFIATNYKPDHLALLVGQKGACSLSDGCGMNVQNTRCMECGGSVENAELSGGNWVTTDDGNHMYIKGGVPIAGNPHVLKQAKKSKNLGGRLKKLAGAIAKRLAGVKDPDAADKAKEREGNKIAAGLAKKLWDKKTPEQKAAAHDSVKKALEKRKEADKKLASDMRDRDAKRQGFKDHADKKAFEETSQRQDRKEAKTSGGGGSKKAKKMATIISAKRANNNLTGDETETVENAINQPKSKNSGKFKPYNAGTGKGEEHEAAQRGFLQFTPRDRELGKIAEAEVLGGVQVPSWAEDGKRFLRAKGEADKNGYLPESYWAAVASIYLRMGGKTIAIPTSNKESEMAKLTAKKREEVINHLCTNCDCWKAEGSKETLNELDDSQIVQLFTSNQAALVVNSLRTELDLPDDLALNAMPAFIKEAIDKKKGKEEPDGDEAKNKKAKNSKSKNADDEELDDEEAPMNKAKNKATKNSEEPTFEDLFKKAPSDIRSAINNAIRFNEKAKANIIPKLVGNAKGEVKKRLEARYGAMDLQELEDELSTRTPATNTRKEEDDNLTLYVGTGGPTDNSDSGSKTPKKGSLRPPTINWLKQGQKKTA